MVAGVWLGNDDDTSTSLAGGNVPVEIWSEFMAKAHEGIPVSELPGAFTSTLAGTEPAQEPVEERPKRTLEDLLTSIFGG
jgi:penicillin-binding protein 1A